ncbi:GNAT family N-acetyltransferase [Maribacter algicola]|uniref:GNAT family N-acetyltransferase n=1 Tax=Meishania litoralis TaxID=3434685 RepID=A0ACC7LJ22_9FLAO
MDFYISNDKSKLNIAAIQQYIGRESYWGMGRTMEEVQRTIDNSLCFGLYNTSGGQMGFSRIVTDYVAFAYLMDVIIFPEYQGRGLGKELVKHMMDHEVIEKVQTVALKTKDAHGLYERFGFKRVGDSPYWMSIDKIKL